MESEEFNQKIEGVMSGEKHLSFSAIKSFLTSPQHFYRYKMEKVTTKAMNDGKIFHMATLEPDKFKETYWVLDDFDKCEEIGGAKPRSTKAYKEWKLEEVVKYGDKEMISGDDFDTFMKMSDYLRVNSATRKLMAGLESKELPIEFEHEGFKIVGQIDGKGKDYIVDLKKVADASFKKVRWVIEDMMLAMQAAIYCQSQSISNYYLIFIDVSCNTTVVKLSTEKIQEGFNKFDIGLNEFRRCAEEDLFHSSYEFFNGGLINY